MAGADSKSFGPRRGGWLLAAAVAIGCLVSLSRWERLADMLGMAPIAAIAGLALQAACSLLIACWLRRSRLQARAAKSLICALVAGVAVMVAVGHPWLNQGGHYPGASDRDEALQAAVGALLDGQDPYAVTKYVREGQSWIGLRGNPVSAMPGELFLAVPFYLLHAMPLQGPFWLLLLALVVARESGDERVGLLVLLVLLGSPTVTVAELLTAGDMFTISAMLAVCAWASYRAKTLPWQVLSRLLFGLAIASRPHLFLLLPVFLLSEAHRDTWRTPGKLLLCLLPGLAAVSVTAMFLLPDPAGFAPFHALAWVGRFQPVTEQVQLWFYVLTVAAGLLACCYAWRGGLARFAFAGGLLLSLPAVVFVVFESLLRGTPTVDHWGWYALPGWILLILAVVSRMARDRYRARFPTRNARHCSDSSTECSGY